MNINIRREQNNDVNAIIDITLKAFGNSKDGGRYEAELINKLRNTNRLSMSLVAIQNDEIVGHIAFSPVTINGIANNWYGLGPVSVLPDNQGKGIGKLLIQKGLIELEILGANGCVVMGSSKYYPKFGFKPYPGLILKGFKPESFMYYPIKGDIPIGEVKYDKSFGME